MKRLSLSCRSIPWPTSKDRLFKEDSDWWHNARIDLGGKGWESYAAGYKEAGDLLARRFLKTCHGNDILTYPMVFLYRHYLELRLKQLIIFGQKALNEPTASRQKLSENHELLELWKSCREILGKLADKRFWPRDPVSRLVGVGMLIGEFYKKDPRGTNFRYPVTKMNQGGQPTLPQLNCVGVRNLYKAMQRLDSFFGAHIAGIQHSPSG